MNKKYEHHPAKIVAI